MTITDIYSGLETLLEAGTWTRHGFTPGIWEYNLMYFKKNKEGIMIKKLQGNNTVVASGKLLFENQQAQIVGWSKTSKNIRNNLYEDLLDILEGSVFVPEFTKRFDAAREHNFRCNVKRIETR